MLKYDKVVTLGERRVLSKMRLQHEAYRFHVLLVDNLTK